MSSALERLQQERKRWRKDHPPGFIARPEQLPNGELNLFKWNCLIPGKPNTLWAGGYYPVTIQFKENYPAVAPIAKFVPPVPHVNVFPSGTICLSILHDNEPGGWKPSITLRQILLGIQNLLDSPNPESPAHEVHYHLYMQNRKQYEQNIRDHAKKFTSQELPKTL